MLTGRGQCGGQRRADGKSMRTRSSELMLRGSFFTLIHQLGSLMRVSTTTRKVTGLRLLSLAVLIKAYIAAARLPPLVGFIHG